MSNIFKQFWGINIILVFFLIIKRSTNNMLYTFTYFIWNGPALSVWLLLKKRLFLNSRSFKELYKDYKIFIECT